MSIKLNDTTGFKLLNVLSLLISEMLIVKCGYIFMLCIYTFLKYIIKYHISKQINKNKKLGFVLRCEMGLEQI